MTIRELAELTQKMRVAQKVYFRTRSTADLTVSKQLERDVDWAVAACLGPTTPTLFDDVVVPDQCSS